MITQEDILKVEEYLWQNYDMGSLEYSEEEDETAEEEKQNG